MEKHDPEQFTAEMRIGPVAPEPVVGPRRPAPFVASSARCTPMPSTLRTASDNASRGVT
jgi:hypothetical protein